MGTQGKRVRMRCQHCHVSECDYLRSEYTGSISFGLGLGVVMDVEQLEVEGMDRGFPEADSGSKEMATA